MDTRPMVRNEFAEQRSPAHDLARSRQMLTAEDVDAIGELVARLPVNDYAIGVDLGAGSGTTALSVMCARAAQREASGLEELGIRLFSFDTDEQMINYTEQALKNTGYEGYWRGFVVDLRVGARYYADAHRDRLHDEARDDEWVGADFLLHDAGHEEGDVYGDLEAWLPKLVPGAMVWIHDYSGPYPGVQVDVDRLVAEGLLEENGAVGLGWVGTKP